MDDGQIHFILDYIEKMTPGSGISNLFAYLVEENKKLNAAVKDLNNKVSILSGEMPKAPTK